MRVNFIPHEVLGPVEVWVPACLDPVPVSRPVPMPMPMPAEVGQRWTEGFEQGRQQGREEARQALGSLESWLAQFHQGLDGVEQDLARRLAGIALQVAGQVVRHELQTRAALVVAVVQEALAEVLLSARHLTVRVHPADQALVAPGCAAVFESRGVRLIADAQIERGGCLVESDLGMVDARLSARWARAAAVLGGDGTMP